MVEGDDTRSATVDGWMSTALPGGSGEQAERLPGVLIERYRIGRRLGAGGMGVVYAARDAHLGRDVAIKLVGPRVEPGLGQGRLAREAKAMASLSHPNIASVYDIGLSGDRLFVVMELLDSGTVTDWLKAEPRSWREVVGVYLQAARGLAAAHAAGFVHRDFKPENLLLGRDGVARVSDFGVARLFGEGERAGPAEGVLDDGSVTRTGGVGTPGYIAPEILRHQPVDARADQFSFCVAVYAALHGERPFMPLEGPDRIAETLGKLRPPRVGKVPRWLHRIITRGLAADPHDRWPTIAALAAAIERRLGRRRRALALTLVGVTAVAATVILTMPRPATAPPPEWSRVMIGRESDSKDGGDMSVSSDGSTLLTGSRTEAWIVPRVGTGARRHVALPSPGKGEVELCKLSPAGDRLYCSFGVDGSVEIWEIDVATGQAERRVPPLAAPTLVPRQEFDVGPGGSLLFSALDGGAVWRVERTGDAQQVLAAHPGQWIQASVWSPGGDRIAFQFNSREGGRIAIMNAATGTIAVVSDRTCAMIAWLTESSLVCVPPSARNPVLIELLLPSGGGRARERVRYNGPEYQVAWLMSASSAGVLLGTKPFELHMALLALDGPGTLTRISSGSVSDLPPAGWTSSGSLIFGSSKQGQLRIMRRLPDGAVETVRTGTASEVPLVVLGDTIVFGRFPGGERTIPFDRSYPDGELFRLAPDGAIEPLGRTRGFMNLVCAGGRATPCLLQERSGDDVTVIDWDAETGARGRQRARWTASSYDGTSTLSPDGRTLAQIPSGFWGNREISLLDLESGNRRRIAVPGTFFNFTGWLPDSTLLASSWGGGRNGIVRVRDAATIEMVAVVPPVDEPWSWACEFLIAPDGKTAAILMGEARTTFWWFPLSAE